MGLIIIMIRYLVLMVALIEAATAVTHQVGNSTGWDVPSSPSFYTTWASSQTFSVGDILEFKWNSTHDVLEVTKTEYEDCTKTNDMQVKSTSPASFTLTNTTARYFICTIGSHCESGQKLAVTSVSATTSTTTPTTSPPPPSGSSASMATAALLPALLSTIAIISFLITI